MFTSCCELNYSYRRFQMFKYIKYFSFSLEVWEHFCFIKYDTDTYILSFRVSPVGTVFIHCLIISYLFVQISFESFFM